MSDQTFPSFFSKSDQFSDPFLVPSLKQVPKTIEEALEFCKFLYYRNPQFQQATRRVVAHFVTKLEPKEAQHDPEESTDRIDFLENKLAVFSALHNMGEDWGCFGLSIWRIHFPFRRYLEDRRDGKSVWWALEEFDTDKVKYHYKEMEYSVPDPRVKPVQGRERPMVRMPFTDLPDADSSRTTLRSIDPTRVTLRKATASGKTDVLWRMDQDFVRDVRNGELYQVNETPMTMLQAIAADHDFLFNPDEVFIFSGATPTGVSNQGWPVPPVIANFSSIFQLQVYRKMDEAIAREYMLPYRSVSPPAGSAPNGGVGQMIDFATWKLAAEEMFKRRRADETSIMAMGLPMEWNEFGGTGRNLVQKDLIEWATADLLNAMGYPAELYNASLQVEQVPTAIRLFESTFYFIYRGFNDFITWVNRKCEQNFQMSTMELRLTPPSIAGDMEARQLYLQLAAGGEISRQKAFEAFNIPDAVQEKVRRVREDLRIDEATAEATAAHERKLQIGTMDAVIGQQQAAQAEAQAAQQGGGAPPPPGAGGAPPGANTGGGSITPMDVSSEAEEMARQFLSMAVGESNRALRDLKATDENKHALVKQKMEELRSRGESQGRAQAAQM